MRNAGRCAERHPACVTSACVSVPSTSVSILEWDGAHAPYCTNDYLNCHTTRGKQKLKLHMIRSVKFYARVRE
jgi:hypothetical protein